MRLSIALHRAARIARYVLVAATCFALTRTAVAQEVPVHGLWVWKTPTLLDLPSRGEALRDFCRSQHINEVYLSFSSQNGGAAEEVEIAKLIVLLHRSHIRVEALLSSDNADQPGKHRDKLLEHVNEVLAFNGKHARDKFDGIHLDVEPQQRQENKGPGNLGFLPDLLDTYRAVRVLAEQNQMTVNADIPNKFLKGDLNQRRALLSSLPRLTLMLYELSSPTDGGDTAAHADKLRQASQRFLDMAYQGLDGTQLARMSIGLRTPDYEGQMANMLNVVQETLSGNPHYLGWAWHSYNDTLEAPP
jgi:hypothetical protein